MKEGKLSICGCGELPKLVEIGSWSAQYQAECKCGRTVIGPYYAHHDAVYRHGAAKKACIVAWNKAANKAHALPT